MSVAIGQPLPGISPIYYGITKPDHVAWIAPASTDETARNIIRHLLGGPLAEIIFTGTRQPARADSDCDRILECSQHLAGDPGKEVTQLRDEVFAFLEREENRGLIEQIADLLEAKGLLGKDDLIPLRP